MNTARQTSSASHPPLPFAALRQNMVDGQLRPNHINQHSLLHALLQLPREAFTPAAQQHTAYLDQPLALPNGREIASPLVTARLIQALQVQPGQRVLVIAANTGYAAALLALLGAQVTATEDDVALRKLGQAATTHHNLAVTWLSASPHQLHANLGPFDALYLDAAFAQPLPAWLSLLTPGGQLVGVQQNASGLMEATHFTRHGQSLIAQVLFETKATLHPALQPETHFVF